MSIDGGRRLRLRRLVRLPLRAGRFCTIGPDRLAIIPERSRLLAELAAAES
jgi:hypothetical protein